MRQMNIEARQSEHTIALLRQKVQQHELYRDAALKPMQLVEASESNDREGSQLSSSDTPVAKEFGQSSGGVVEAGSFTEAFSSDEDGSIGEHEDTEINKSVLKRETSPGRMSPGRRSASPLGGIPQNGGNMMFSRSDAQNKFISK